MQPSIYGPTGRDPAVEAAVDFFYEKVWICEKVWADPALAHHFEGIDRARRKAHQRAFMTAELGGGADTVFDRVVAHLATALSGLGLDEDTIGEIADGLTPLRAGVAAATGDGF